MAGIGTGLAALNIGARLTGAKAALAKVPSWLWGLIAAVVLGFVLYLAHQHKVHKHDAALVTATRSADNAAWQKAFAKERAAALAWKARTEQQGVTIAAQERKIHDQTVADNARLADALRMRGPGAASAGSCRPSNHPAASAAPGGHVDAAATAGAPAAAVPSEEWALVPWNWLVTVVQEHDDLRATVKAIFDNDAKQRANWPTKSK